MTGEISARHHVIREWFAKAWPGRPLELTEWTALLPSGTTPDELDEAFLDWQTDHPKAPPRPGNIATLISAARRSSKIGGFLADARTALKSTSSPGERLEAARREQLRTRPATADKPPSLDEIRQEATST